MEMIEICWKKSHKECQATWKAYLENVPNALQGG